MRPRPTIRQLINKGLLQGLLTLHVGNKLQMLCSAYTPQLVWFMSHSIAHVKLYIYIYISTASGPTYSGDCKYSTSIFTTIGPSIPCSNPYKNKVIIQIGSIAEFIYCMSGATMLPATWGFINVCYYKHNCMIHIKRSYRIIQVFGRGIQTSWWQVTMRCHRHHNANLSSTSLLERFLLILRFELRCEKSLQASDYFHIFGVFAGSPGAKQSPQKPQFCNSALATVETFIVQIQLPASTAIMVKCLEFIQQKGRVASSRLAAVLPMHSFPAAELPYQRLEVSPPIEPLYHRILRCVGHLRVCGGYCMTHTPKV